jgi:hypothetical protein
MNRDNTGIHVLVLTCIVQYTTGMFCVFFLFYATVVQKQEVAYDPEQ